MNLFRQWFSRTTFLAALMIGLITNVPTNADMIIAWDTSDAVFDGVVNGTFAGGDVLLTSTDGPFNGGAGVQFGSNISFTDPAIPATSGGGTFDWNSNEAGFLNLELDVAAVDPVFVFAFLDGSMSFDFDDSLSLTLIGTSIDPFVTPPGTMVTIDPGNIVRTSGHVNQSEDAFALRIDGTISSLSVDTNVDLGASNSVLVQMHATAIPEPSSHLCCALVALVMGGYRRRRLIASDHA